MSQKTMCVSQEGPANALALNRENNQVVIAGRNGMDYYIISKSANMYYLMPSFVIF